MIQQTYLFTLVFVIGIILGSFYNVVGLRVPLKQSIIKPRSSCPICRQKLKTSELIPIISYLVQCGKCRNCTSPISPIYPLVEITTGILFVLAPILLGWTPDLFIAWSLISLLVIIFVTDISYMLIPNKIIFFFMFMFILLIIIKPLNPWWDSITGTVIGFGIPLVITLISKGGMGGGDIKLFGIIGFLMGSKGVILAFIFSTFYGALFGFVGLVFGRLKQRKPIPFGPFIAFGTLTSYFFGNQILNWYLLLLQ